MFERTSYELTRAVQRRRRAIADLNMEAVEAQGQIIDRLLDDMLERRGATAHAGTASEPERASA